MEHDGLTTDVFPQAKILSFTLLAYFGFTQFLVSYMIYRSVQKQIFAYDILLKAPVICVQSAVRAG